MLLLVKKKRQLVANFHLKYTLVTGVLLNLIDLSPGLVVSGVLPSVVLPWAVNIYTSNTTRPNNRRYIFAA